MNVREFAQEKNYRFGHMTIGQCIEAAAALNMRVGDVIIEEDADFEGITHEDVVRAMRDAFAHNLKACQLGLTIGHSSLLGDVGKELNGDGAARIVDDPFVNRVVVCTLAAQVGNHTIGLRPCAGTGDSCPYTGFVTAVQEFYPGEEELLNRILAVMLKIGGMYRIGKCTTGCNMEGLGAGACATAAAYVELAGGTPEQMEKAMVLAISPTISVPCTPRVLAPGLCATHIGGGVLIARLASQLAMHTTIPLGGIPVDVMIAMAAQCHLASAQHVVPVTIKYMESFFKRDARVEQYVKPEVITAEAERKSQVVREALAEAAELASRANLITAPFADAVVGGTSEGVGSPTNCARLAHFLAKGEVTRVKVEFCSEMFARRTINIPGVLMAAVNGCGTDDADAYESILAEVKERGIEVEVLEVDVPQLQKVTVYATEQNSFVDSLNRAGARLVLRDASAPREDVLALAKKLNIVIIDQ